MMKTLGRMGSGLLVWAVVVLAGCDVTDPDASRNLQFGATANVAGDTVRFTLLVTNPTSDTVPFIADGRRCPGAGILLAYTDDAGSARLRWHEERWVVACWMEAETYSVEAGGELELSRYRLVREILGDSLPSGSYELRLELNLEGFPRRVIPMGEHILSR